MSRIARQVAIGVAIPLLWSSVNCGRSNTESAEKALARGKELFNAGDYGKAIEELRIATGSRTVAMEAHYWLGCAFEQLRDLRDAETEYVTVALEDDHYSDVRMRLAKIQVRDVNPQEAVWGGQWAEKEIGETNDHGSADAYYVLGIRAVRQGHPDQAHQYLEKSLSVDRGHRPAAKALTIAALLHGDRMSAENTLLALPQSAENAELTGEFYRLTGDLGKAERWFREALKLNNKLAVASANLADTLWMAGKRQEALDVLSALNQTGSNPFEYLHALAVLANGDIDQSSAELTALAKKPQFSPDAESRLVAALIAGKRFDNAAGAVDARLAVSPMDPRAITDRVVLSMSTPGGSKDVIERDLKGLRERGVDSDLLHYLTAVLAIRRGKDFILQHAQDPPFEKEVALEDAKTFGVEAEGEFRESLTVNPSFVAARIELARLLVQHKKLPVAIGLMDDMPLDQRRRPSAVLQRAWFFLASGEKPVAKRLLEASSLSLPVPLDSVTPAMATEAVQKAAQDNLRFDLLEFPQGPIFQETDMELLSFYPLNKGVVRWMAF
jgi:Tfp pilus assembly protein PilF